MLNYDQKTRKIDGDGLVVIHKTNANAHIAKFTVKGSQSSYFSEQRAFICFCVELNDKDKVPGWTRIRDQNTQRRRIQKLTIKTSLSQRERYLSLKTDMWTSISKQGYMIISAHFIDDNLVMRYLVIYLVYVLFSRSAERLVQYICEALWKRDLLKKSWTVTTVDISTKTAVMSILKNRLNDERTLPLSDNCITRLLVNLFYLAINDACITVTMLDEAIGHLRDIPKNFLDSPKLVKVPQRIFLDLGMTSIILVLDVEKRWDNR